MTTTLHEVLTKLYKQGMITKQTYQNALIKCENKTITVKR